MRRDKRSTKSVEPAGISRGLPATAEQPTGNVTPFPAPDSEQQGALRAKPYPVRVPNAEYLAVCVQAFGPHRSRLYGEKIYLTFQVVDGAHAGKKLPMFLRPSKFPTSNLYRFWCLANGGLPSRNARLSPRIFLGRVFTIRTVTVRPRQRISRPDGRTAQGDFFPEFFWYSRVDSIVRLECTGTLSETVTENSPKSFPGLEMGTGGVGSRKPETGSEPAQGSLKGVRGETPVGSTNQAGGGGKPVAGPTPVKAPGESPEAENECYAARRVLLKEKSSLGFRPLRALADFNDGRLGRLLVELRELRPDATPRTVDWAIGLVHRRAKSPPGSLAFFERALPLVFEHLEVETEKFLVTEARGWMLRQPDRPGKLADAADVVKSLAAEYDLSYDAALVDSVIERAFAGADGERKLQSELAVGRRPEPDAMPPAPYRCGCRTPHSTLEEHCEAVVARGRKLGFWGRRMSK